MALLDQIKDILDLVIQLRDEGLTDNLIMEELRKRGYSPTQISQAILQTDQAGGDSSYPASPELSYPIQPSAPAGGEGDIYERMEEIAETMIDEKWDELITEVKKIIAWKEKIEEKQQEMENDLEKLKEDFKLLHQGVLGQLEEYDTRMRDVGTELKAVGKVFKDVIPTFTDKVKELSSIVETARKTVPKKGK